MNGVRSPSFKQGATLGDFARSCAVLFSGNDYTKICLYLNSLNMRPMSRTTNYKICDKYGIEAVNAAVNAAWKEQQKEMVKEYAGKDVILVGERFFNLWS